MRRILVDKFFSRPLVACQVDCPKWTTLTGHAMDGPLSGDRGARRRAHEKSIANTLSGSGAARTVGTSPENGGHETDAGQDPTTQRGGGAPEMWFSLLQVELLTGRTHQVARWGFGFEVSGFGFQVSGFGFRFDGCGFMVSGFGVRVWG